MAKSLRGRPRHLVLSPASIARRYFRMCATRTIMKILPHSIGEIYANVRRQLVLLNRSSGIGYSRTNRRFR